MSTAPPSASPQGSAQNRLAQETSPYLLQHQHNPVDWWAWGPNALDEAKRSGKPILLSVGYAACHWCHVMAHESFEDDDTARVMNELFVNIKVDSEERPDNDQIYMAARHHLGEHGGWPLTMFLTPSGEPIWGGTYFPKTSRYGKPAFVAVLREIARLFREEPQKIETNRAALMEQLAATARKPGTVTIGAAELDNAARQLGGIIDPVNGGTRGAPNFPKAALFELLWRAGLRNGEARYFAAVDITLDHICEGGIYDHLGGGFSRYSVDERWLVPHFEKMLYDNAQLLELLALAHVRSGTALFRERAEETVGWLAREMTTPGGAFCASLDADSEGEEGKFYVWSRAEIEEILGKEDADYVEEYYDVTGEGNFEGHNILNRLKHLSDQHGQSGGPSSPGSVLQRGRNMTNGSAAPAQTSVAPKWAPAGESCANSMLQNERSMVADARLAALRHKLLQARNTRVRPGLDDKVLADWNGLTIAALANSGVTLRQPHWLDMAKRAFAFIERH